MRAIRHPVVDQHPGLVRGLLEVDGPHSRAVLVREQVEEVPLPADALLSIELVGAVQRQLGLAPVGALLRPGQPFDVRRQRVQATVEPGIARHAQHLAHLVGGAATRARQRHAERHRDRVRRQHQVARLRGELAVEATGECVQAATTSGIASGSPADLSASDLTSPRSVARSGPGFPLPAHPAASGETIAAMTANRSASRRFSTMAGTLPAASGFRSHRRPRLSLRFRPRMSAREVADAPWPATDAQAHPRTQPVLPTSS